MYTNNSTRPSHPPRPSANGVPTNPEPQQEYIEPIAIAVMGATGSGKSSFINLASGSNLHVGANLESCTANVQLAGGFTIDGRPVVLIDTPGFDDTKMSDTDVLKLIAAFLATTYETGSKLAGVIYIHRISDRRFTGITARNFTMFRELCGDSTLKNVVLITNMWGDVSEDVGKARENELITNFFKPVLDKGAQIARHYNTVESAHGIIRRILGNRPTTLQIQRELVDKHKDIIDTAAGEAINKELNEQMRRHQAGMRELQEETEKALKKKDEETRQELEEEKRKLQGQMDKIRMESEGMASSYQEEKERMEESVRQVQEKARGMEENMRQTQEEARQEKERANASQKQQMDTLNKQLQDNAKASAAEREAMEQRLNQQHQQDNRPKPKRPIGFFDVALLVVAPGLGIINLMIR